MFAARCVAENSAGRAETVASLFISRPPSVRLQPAGSLQLQLGQPLTLRCLASGDPQPTVTWRKVGAEGVQEMSGGQEVLEVAAVRREDEGTYSCLASSSAGEVEERVQVLVLEGDDGGWGEGGGSRQCSVALRISHQIPFLYQSSELLRGKKVCVLKYLDVELWILCCCHL